ncbi:MAG: hypothetical protein QNK37_26495 [Acidobacteriota bacterium]|nr:hypothetical protein [Acidobacteriota bacterium]
MEVPSLLKKAAACHVIAIILLIVSLFCNSAVPYLLTLGLGGALMFLGLLLAAIDLFNHWQGNEPAED